MKLVVFAACVLALVLWWTWWAPQHGGFDPSGSAPADPAAPAATAPRLAVRAGAERQPVAPAPPARVRFVDAADGRPVPGARLLRTDGERTLEPQHAIAIADDGGAMDLAGLASDRRYVAFAEAMVPLPVSGWALVPDAVFRLQRGGTVTVWCVDEVGVALPGVWVQATSARLAETFAFDATRAGIANPHRKDAAAFVCSDARGMAAIPSRPSGDCFLRAQHPTHLLDATKSDAHRPLGGGATSATLHFRTAMGIVAALPDGRLATSWDFVVTPPGFERELYSMARSIAVDLRRRFPGAGSYALPRFVDGPAPRVAVSALAEDGSLWTGEAELTPIASIREPTMLQGATRPTGWIQVTVQSAGKDVVDLPLHLVSSAGRMWSVPSGRAVQLPCGHYHVGPAQLCPVVDEAFDAKVLEVVPSSREQCSQVAIDIGAIGFASLQVRSEADLGVDASVSVRMPGGHAFTLRSAGAAFRLYLPAGEHQLQIGAPEHLDWRGAIAIRAGETTTAAIVLRRRRE